jgi:hypothetical protein
MKDERVGVRSREARLAIVAKHAQPASIVKEAVL